MKFFVSRRRELRRAFDFLLIGGGAFVVDAATYNILVFGWGHDIFAGAPLGAKAISIALGTIASFAGNRVLTYRDRKSQLSARQFISFCALNLVAIALQLGFLGFSRYVLGLDSVAADNLWGTVIGQAAAMAFRYVTYSRFVFPAAASTATTLEETVSESDNSHPID